MNTLSIVIALVIFVVLQYTHFKLFVSMGSMIIVVFIFHIFKYGLGIGSLAEPILTLIKDRKFYEVMLMIYLIYVLGEILKNSNIEKKLKDGIGNLFSDSKLSTAFIPMIIGLMPMPAGAMFTAPIVKPIGKDSNMSDLDIAATNYWFRHTMEFSWLVYPAMLIASSFGEVSLKEFMLRMLPTTIGAIIAGFLIVKVRSFKMKFNLSEFFQLFKSLFPILIIIILVLLGVKGVMAILISVIFSCIIYKNFSSFIKGFKPDIILLLIMIFFYKAMMVSYGISKSIAIEMTNWNVPIILIIIMMPFILGLATGITYAAVGMSFPTIFALNFSMGKLDLSMISYFSAVIGVLLSPVHLCLILSAQYFGVSIWKILRKLILVFTVTVVVFTLSIIFF